MENPIINYQLGRLGCTHLPRYSPVVGAALPEPTAEAFDVSDSFLLVRKVHFPDQGAVTEHPHDTVIKMTAPQQGRIRRNEPVPVGSDIYSLTGICVRFSYAGMYPGNKHPGLRKLTFFR